MEDKKVKAVDAAVENAPVESANVETEVQPELELEEVEVVAASASAGSYPSSGFLQHIKTQQIVPYLSDDIEAQLVSVGKDIKDYLLVK